MNFHLGSQQLVLEIGGVELAAEMGVARGVAAENAGGAQAVKAFRRGTGTALQDATHDFAKVMVFSQ